MISCPTESGAEAVAASIDAIGVYRHQLAECADHLSASVARAALNSDPLELETLSIQLNGTARLALQLRAVILIGAAP